MSTRAERATRRAHRARMAAETHDVRRGQASELDATQVGGVMLLLTLTRDNAEELAALVDMLNGDDA